MRLTKYFVPIFALAERLPTSAPLLNNRNCSAAKILKVCTSNYNNDADQGKSALDDKWMRKLHWYEKCFRLNVQGKEKWEDRARSGRNLLVNLLQRLHNSQHCSFHIFKTRHHFMCLKYFLLACIIIQNSKRGRLNLKLGSTRAKLAH